MDADGHDPRIRLRCPFCLDLLTILEMAEHRSAANGCPKPLYSDGEGIYCFTCGASNGDVFSMAQKSRAEKGSSARCNDCIAKGLQSRFRPPIQYPARWAAGQRLMHFVSAINVEGVREMLEGHGADIANHNRHLDLGLIHGHAWDEQGLPWPDTDKFQPFSPLRMVVFRISDCCLSLGDLKQFLLIAQLLIDAGSDPVDAAAFLQQRYGSFGGDLDDSGFEISEDDFDAKVVAFRAVCRTIKSAAESGKAVGQEAEVLKEMEV